MATTEDPGNIDILDAFGPLASVHAAMDKAGVGMPCGVIARVRSRNVEEVDTAISEARLRFPVLSQVLIWRGSRAVLMDDLSGAPATSLDAFDKSLNIEAEQRRPVWAYRLDQDGEDVWFQAHWRHAAADGLSMLRFLRAVGASLTRTPLVAETARTGRGPGRRTLFTAWLLRLLVDQNRLSVVDLRRRVSGQTGVTWVTIPGSSAQPILANARAEAGGFAGYLAAAASLAFFEQNGSGPRGRVMLNVPVARRDLERFGGFGFGVGSLLLSVPVSFDSVLQPMARYIADRLSSMAHAQWDYNLERFLGRSPAWHRFIAAARARRQPDPTLNVSWKGSQEFLGGPDCLRDIACFGVAPGVHVSGHSDLNGLSVSVASSQLSEDRIWLLRRLIHLIGATVDVQLYELQKLDGASPRPVND